MQLLDLSDFGLVTVETAAEMKECDPSTVRRWASRGEIPVLILGSGRSAKFLLRRSDVANFIPNGRGAPVGNQNAKKEDDETPTKTSESKESGKKPGKS